MDHGLCYGGRFMIRRIRNGLLMGIAVLLLSACSKTVTWEEEVPLNTGEVIWVKRSMPWTYMGGFGNPFDIAMRPTGEQTISFKYKESKYEFSEKIVIGWLLISPDGRPVIVGIPSSYGWNYLHENSYRCVIPYYVQFSFDEATGKWVWPKKIDEWLYGAPANLMVSLPQLNDSHPSGYSSKDREFRDKSRRIRNDYLSKIDPAYDADGNCPHQ